MVSLAQVLEWKYGLVAGTKQKDPNDISANPEMEISSWNHPDISKPNKTQLVKDFKEYESHIAKKDKDKKDVKDAKDTLINKYKGKKKNEITDEDATEWQKLTMAEELEIGL